MKDIDLVKIKSAIKSGRLEVTLENDGTIMMDDTQTKESILIGKAKNIGLFGTVKIEMER